MRWVPRLSTMEIKCKHVVDLVACLALSRRSHIVDYIKHSIQRVTQASKTMKSVGKVMSTLFMGWTRNYLHGLFKKRTNDKWRLLCVVIGPQEPRNKEKNSTDVSGLLSIKCTSATQFLWRKLSKWSRKYVSITLLTRFSFLLFYCIS